MHDALIWIPGWKTDTLNPDDICASVNTMVAMVKALVSITELYLSEVLTFRGGGLKGTQDFCVLFLQLFDSTLRIKINSHKPKTDCPVAVLTKYPPDPVLNQPGQQTSVFVAIDWPESCSFLCWVWCRGIQEAFN